jgi:muramoyltetrapeptide carboxypeptidase
MLCSLRGTPYDIDPRGRILFLEDLDELRYHADRMVQNLRHGGWFSELAGLVVGAMTQMRDKDPADPFGMEVEEMVAEAVAPYGYPVCYGFPAGHIADNRALVLGAKAKLNVTPEGATLSFGRHL